VKNEENLRKLKKIWGVLGKIAWVFCKSWGDFDKSWGHFWQFGHKDRKALRRISHRFYRLFIVNNLGLYT